MKDNFNIRLLIANTYSQLDAIHGKMLEYKKSFYEFDEYITNDPKKSFKKFFQNIEVKPKLETKSKENIFGVEEEQDEDEIDAKNPLLKNVVTKMPSFQLFDEKILQLKAVKKKVGFIKNHVEIHWLRINAESLKQSLEVTLNEWIFVYIHFLNTQVKTMIKNCKRFEKYLIEGISVNP